MRTVFNDLYNAANAQKGNSERVFAIDFATLELLVTRLRSTPPPAYPANRLEGMFDRWMEATDDLRAQQVLVEALMAEDAQLVEDVAAEVQREETRREAELKNDLQHIEDKLRDRGVTGGAANQTLVYLAFLRLYEERRQRERREDNRFTEEGFDTWVKSVSKLLPQEVGKYPTGRMVEMLLHQVAADPELVAAKLLRGADGQLDHLHGNVDDSFVIDEIFPVFDKFDFHNTRLDVLGAVFETLARRAEKDVRVGQFFTPSSAVEFSADLVKMRSSDVLLDPCVGTGRYTIVGMERMLSLATDDAERNRIKKSQVLGSDIDSWVSTIARMNMFIHGDGKSNIINENGLILGDRNVFVKHPKGINAKVSVVLTNPPLGDTSYTVAADRWASLAAEEAGKEEEGPAEGAVKGEYLSALGVVPIKVKEEERAELLRQRIEEKEEALSACTDPKAHVRLRKGLDKAITDLATANAKLATGDRTYDIKGSMSKGGALFLGAIANYLVDERVPGELPEWRGGRCAIIVDDGILNTPDYAHVREFIRERFYIKAVVSLGRGAFKYLAHTDAKTSILYLVKKPNVEWEQVEPVLFAHAERIGYGNTGKWVGDDLPNVLSVHRRFENLVRGAYAASALNEKKLKKALDGFDSPEWDWLSASLPEERGARLDYSAARYTKMAENVQLSSPLTLKDLLEVRMMASPAYAPAYDFATMERGQGIIRSKGHEPTQYSTKDLRCVREGDIVVSGIDVVNGSVAIAGPDVDGCVLSKEFYAYRVKKGVSASPEFIAVLLRSQFSRKLIAGLVSGTSMRTRLESAEQLLELPLPSLPQETEIMEITSKRREWGRLQGEAAQAVVSIEQSADALWP
jgi:type I restriction-modification system DNA methylase subunit